MKKNVAVETAINITHNLFNLVFAIGHLEAERNGGKQNAYITQCAKVLLLLLECSGRLDSLEDKEDGE